MSDSLRSTTLPDCFAASASLEGDIDGSIVTRREWVKDGELHRVGGPARIELDAVTGVVTAEEWLQHGLYHRLDGPALIYRDSETGKVTEAEWYLHDRRVEPDLTWLSQPAP